MNDMLFPLIMFALAMSFTPGPNVVMVTASAANHGFVRVIPHMIGIAVGFGLMVTIVGVGLGGLVLVDPRFHEVLKWAGAAYLLYLAWRTANAGASGKPARIAKPIGFCEAALFQWVNPKGWVFAVGALSSFTRGDLSIWTDTIVVTTVLSTACLASVLVWAAFGVKIGHMLKTCRARVAFNRCMAAALVASLVPVLSGN
jgi:threonine/homoserine/homoserine lactone efflux protein